MATLAITFYIALLFVLGVVGAADTVLEWAVAAVTGAIAVVVVFALARFARGRRKQHEQGRH